MARYLQKIVLDDRDSREWWVGWEIDDVTGIDGLVCADDMSEDQIRNLGITEFIRVSKESVGKLERRRVQRIRLAPPLTGSVGSVAVEVLDVSVGGAGIEHRFPLAVGKAVRLRYRFQGAMYSVEFETLKCQLRRKEEGGICYYSALKIHDGDADAQDALRHLVQTCISEHPRPAMHELLMS